MARYIDANESVDIGYLSDWYQNSIDDTKPPIWTDEHLEELLNDFIVIPNDTPTADVVGVKHGYWKHTVEFGNVGKYHYWNCSLCGVASVDEDREKYCHECGAKMDGKNDFKE